MSASIKHRCRTSKGNNHRVKNGEPYSFEIASWHERKIDVPDIALAGAIVGQKNAHAYRTVMDCYPSTAFESVHIRSEMVSREIFSAINYQRIDFVVHLCRNLCRPPLCFHAYGAAWVYMSFQTNFRMRNCFKGRQWPQPLRLHHR